MNEKKTILAVFNSCLDTNIPLDNFMHLDSSKFNLNIVSLYQNTTVLKETIKRIYPGRKSSVYGLKDFSNQKISFIFKLRRLIISINPDIIHIHHNLSGLLVSFIGKIFTKSIIVATVHNNYHYFTKRQQIVFFISYFMVNSIVCNSKSTLRSIAVIRKLLPFTEKVCVIYNGIDSFAIQNSKNYDFSLCAQETNIFRIGCVANLITQKDHRTLIKAFGLFSNKYPSSKLFLAGNGPLAGKLKNLAKELSLQNNIYFLGSLTRTQVFSLLKDLSVFTITSRWEGFCNAMVEAMAAGKAIIASDIITLREVMGQDNGLFFPVGDDNELFRKLCYLYENQCVRNKLGQKAKKYALSLYPMEACAKAYENLYISLFH